METNRTLPTRAPGMFRLLAIAGALCGGAALGGAEPRGNGDVNCDGTIDLSDAVSLLGWLYLGGPPPCPAGGCRTYQEQIDQLNLLVAALQEDVERCRAELEALQPKDWIVVPVQAVFVSNDDGSRPCNIAASQVLQWVDEANRVYEPARIFFEFDPNPRGGSWTMLRSSLINGITGVEQPDWAQRVAAGDAAAARYPGKLVAFFRHGPGPSPTGGGFSWTDYDFVAMPGFNDTSVCGHQNLTIFAHEVGHYLGLSHSFSAEYTTVAAAASAFTGAGSDPAVFDGDGILDTAPDPFIRDQQCNGSLGVTLAGVPLAVGRHDIMSYYDSPRKTLSPGQIAIARQVALIRIGGDLREVLEPPALQMIEGEAVAGGTSGSGSFGPQTNMASFHGKWSGEAQLWWGGAAGGSITSQLPVSQAGLYRLYGCFTLAPDFGIHAISLNGVPAKTLDLHSGVVRLGGPDDLGVFWLKAGANSIRFQSAGKSPRSSGFGLGLDHLLLQKLD